MTVVRAVPWPGGVPGDGYGLPPGTFLVVLADDTGQRVVPLWLRFSVARDRVHTIKELWLLLARPTEAVTAGVLPGTVARLLHEAGVRVTAVDIEPASEDVPELRSDTVAARIGLATATGARPVKVSVTYGLALAAAAGAPIRVADEVMDRLAVPMPDGDALAPFLPLATAAPPGHPRHQRPNPA